MVFSSLVFLFAFLPVTLALYYVLPLKWRNAVLLLVSLAFYGWGEPVYVLLMAGSIVVDYVFGLMVEKYRSNDAKARRFVIYSVVFNLGLLFVFKYLDFIIENLRLIPLFSSLSPLGLELPIGISFYTFQKLSYTIDIYRGEAKAQKRIVNFGAFVTLFPQLIAGPIIRYKDVDDQLSERSHSVEKFASGVEIFCVGLAKKVLLANGIGALWDAYKLMPAAQVSVLGAWLGVIAFSFQIYFDFSGYSDMAIGLGRMFGFEFIKNFDYPYISRSITEFWRRWHISLGSWFRSYLYIPLGGNRRGIGRQLLNIGIVWACTGLWHGASWNYLVWGLYFAVILMLEKLFLLKWLEKAPKWVGHVYALILIVIGWAIFGIEDIALCIGYLGRMFGIGGAGLVSAADGYYLREYALMLVVLTAASLPVGAKLVNRLDEKKRGILVLVLSALCLAVCTAYLVNSTYNPFLYFRF